MVHHQLKKLSNALFAPILASSLTIMGLSACNQVEKPNSETKAETKAEAKDETKAEAKAETTQAKLTVTLPTIPNGKPIPAEHSFCVEDGKGKGTFGPNKSPEIKWSGAPEGTKSFAVVAVDPKVPSKADNVNQEGKTVSASLPRVNFYHWLLADIPADVSQLAAGVEGEKVVPKGKPAGKVAHGVRGVNNYSDWFASNAKMSGTYGGYDGPCPPWNDEIVHEYHFEVYALDVATLGLKDGFKGPDLVKAMEGHVLAQGKSVGLYKLNTAVKY